ncbi:terpene synthase family protein [Streptomyces diastatochromogenes]|uniref:terpene synthase family protein n=1 Tax=Streptomyces diastatochromogenes TaxID=42236 RepID=UPI0036A52896
MTYQGVVFTAPWPLRFNPHVDAARESAIDWMRGFDLLHGEQAVEDFTNWRLAEVAGFFYPQADLDACCTAAQMMGWYFLPFDDQLDGEAGRDPRRVARICGALIDIVHGTPGTERHQAPTVRAFADLWERMVRGMSAPLRSRVAHHWSSYFASQLTEAIDRTDGRVHTDLEEYFQLRAATTCAFGQNDLAEHWGGVEVAPVVWHHPLLRRMRQLAADLVGLRNDSMSLNHEDVTGGHNVIHLVERTHGCTRDEALVIASGIAQGKADELVELERQELPRIARALDDSQRVAVAGYADILHDWVCGDYEWERITTRHHAHRTLPEWATSLLVGAEG